MKEIVIISGKGGTGKTSLTAAFATLASKDTKAVYADCDVDAADLHLIFSPEILEKSIFKSGRLAVIFENKCSGCGKCAALCRFEAIEKITDTKFKVLSSSCEGCGVCVHFCPEKAIDFPEHECGTWFISSTRFGTLVHAELYSQAENSGKLVSVVRKKAQEIAHEEKADYIIVDGPPGIGCPVIASISGATAVVAVTEPTLSGKHDLDRVSGLVKHFKIPLYVIVNKWDINPAMAKSIKKECMDKNNVFLGMISFDSSLTQAQIAGKSVLEYTKNKTTLEITKLWEDLCRKIS